MNQDTFIAERRQRWDELEQLLDTRLSARQGLTLPRIYRAVCDDLALARQRRFDAPLVERLNLLVLKAHHRLYRPERGSWRSLVAFFAFGFPQAVRAEWRLVLFMHGIFYGSLAGIIALILHDPGWVYSVLSPEQALQVQEMYDHSGPMYLKPRGADEDTFMFGFYVYNNVSIAFRTFASGIFLGLGSILILLYNGLFIGGVAGHLHDQGLGMNLLQFVVGHGSLELTAIVLSGVAGLRLGLPLVAPGSWSRAEAVRRAARRAIPIVFGAFAMLVAAAVVEAYWSSSRTLPLEVKLGVGAAGWTIVILYLLLAGRFRGH